ncbi:MAG: helix-turn-helix transcriptional regulator [Acidimicrobiales bacterium]
MSRSTHWAFSRSRFKTTGPAADMNAMTMELSPEYAQVLEVPAARLGRFLAAARTREGIALADIARRLEWKFTPVVLSMIERGVYPILPEDVPGLVDAYRVDLDKLLPERDNLEVNLDSGTIGSGESIQQLADRLTITELLRNYLSFVREIRGLRPDSELPRRSLRHDDMEILARTLRLESDDVEQRLAVILDPAAANARRAIEKPKADDVEQFPQPMTDVDTTPPDRDHRRLFSERAGSKRGLRERLLEATENKRD